VAFRFGSPGLDTHLQMRPVAPLHTWAAPAKQGDRREQD